MEWLAGKKTYLAAAGLVVYAAVGWALTAFAPEAAASANINVDFQTAITLALNALGLGGLRSAVAKQ